MKNDLVVPRINTNDNQIEIAHWYVDDNEFIEKGKDVVDIATSKAVVTISAESSGYIHRLGNIGDTVSVGDPLATLYSDLSEAEVFTKTGTRTKVSEKAPTETKFSKEAKRYIEEHKLDLKIFNGFGMVSLEKAKQMSGAQSLSVSAKASSSARTESLTKAKRLEIDFLTSGQAGNINSSITVGFNSNEIRKTLIGLNSLGGEILPLVLYEFSRLLETHPKFTSYYEDEKIHYHDVVHIGLAVELERGLKVLTLRDANKLLPEEINKKVNELALKYINGKLDVDNVEGSTVTVTDLTTEDVLYFQPLINHRQSVILGIGGDKGLMGYPMTFTITFDHRIMTGREVAEFLNKLKTRVLSYEAKNLPQTDATLRKQNIKCSKCFIGLDDYYREFKKDGFMQTFINESGLPDYLCHVCLAGH